MVNGCFNEQDHQFFKVQEATELDHLLVQCAKCGEVRALTGKPYDYSVIGEDHAN